MRTKEYHRKIERQNRTIHEIYYYADSGRMIAFFLDSGMSGPRSKILCFNSDLLAVPRRDPRSKNMTFVQRAKPEYRADFREIESRHPGIPRSEFTNV